MSTPHRRRSAAPWLFGLAALLAILSPLVFLGVWVAEGTAEGVITALVATVLDLVAATIAAVVAAVLALQRGVVRVRTAVLGHPDGRAGRLAEHDAARWRLARDRFAALQREYAAFEADPGAVAARPALTDVTVPATARFVQALADAEYLRTDDEPVGPRRAEFANAVERAVDAWENACSVADGLARAHHGAVPPVGETRAVDPPRRPGTATERGEYADAAEAVRRAAVRGAKDLRERLRA
jgi:hypothetical protein